MKVADPKSSRIDRMFRAFSDRTRLRILSLLRPGELCVCDIVEVLALPQPKISRHLAYLRKAGLVDVRRDGQWMHYKLAAPVGAFHIKLLDCLACCLGDVPELARDAEKMGRKPAARPAATAADFLPAYMRVRGYERTLMKKLKVMFLCTGNSCRSQMAEGWARHLKGDVIDAYSAGVSPHGMNARVVKAMVEAGVDISGQSSKHADTLADISFDYVVTVCGHANETCPMFPGKTTVVHVGFDDPPKLAEGAASEDEAMSHYRRVRDEIKAFIETLPGSLNERGAA